MVDSVVSCRHVHRDDGPSQPRWHHGALPPARPQREGPADRNAPGPRPCTTSAARTRWIKRRWRVWCAASVGSSALKMPCTPRLLLAGHGPAVCREQAAGGAWVLEHLWRRVGIRVAIVKLLRGRKYALPVERALFALVANRAPAPASKLACERWVAEEVVIPELPQVPVDHLYRAMDLVLEAQEEVQREVFFATSDLLNLEVNLLYFDTISTYFEIEEEDADTSERPGWRKRGYSCDHRPDLPQVTIGLEMTREGIPIRCWCWPDKTHDTSVITQAKRGTGGVEAGAGDHGGRYRVHSAENLRTLQRTGGHYIAGEKLRGGKAVVAAAMRRPGRYKAVRDNLEVKKIVLGTGEARIRYILVRNPQEAARDRRQREETLRRLREELAALPAGPTQEHSRAACALLSHPTYRRYLRTATRGRVRSTRTRFGPRRGSMASTWCAPRITPSPQKMWPWVTSSSSRSRTPSARSNTPWTWRPLCHRVEERIRAHLLLCWLALLLVRISERRATQRWPQIRRALQRLHLGELPVPRVRSGSARRPRRTSTTSSPPCTSPSPRASSRSPPARARTRAL